MRSHNFCISTLFGLVLLLIGAGIGAAQEATPVAGSGWVSLGLVGKEIREIAVNPASPSIIYAAARDGVYEGSSSGGPWIPLTIDLPGLSVYALEVNSSIPSTLYLGALGTLYKSRNGGRTWGVALRELTNPPFSSLAVQPEKFDTLYVANKIGIMRTVTGGDKGWDQADGGISSRDIKLVAMDPANADRLYAGTAGGVVYRSTNAGKNWQPAGKGLPGTAITALVVNADSAIYVGTRKQGLFRSVDAGGSWKALGKATAALTVQSVAIDPAAPSKIFAATGSAGILASTDNGATWAAFNKGLADQDVRVIRILPSDRKGELAVYAGTNNGIWKLSAAAGKAPAVPLEFNEVPSHQFVRTLAIDPKSSSTIYAGTAGNGIFKSTNNGASWTAANLPGTSVVAIAIAPDSTVYAGTRGKIYQSTDGGGTWRVSLTDMADPYFFGIAVDPKSKIIFEGNEYGISKSTSGGHGWDNVEGGDDLKDILALQMHISQPGTLLAATDGHGVFVGRNGGAQWAALNSGLTQMSVLALAQEPKSGGNTLYAGTDGGGVFKSIDGGKNWQPAMSAGLSHAPVTALALDPASSSTIFAGVYGAGIQLSTDGGKTWRSMNEGLGSLRVRALAVEPDHSGNLWVGTDGAGIFRSTNAGKSWRVVSFGYVSQASAGEQQIDLPDFDADIAKYTAEIEQRPSDAEAHDSLALAFYGKGNFAKAEEQYQKALSLDSTGTYFHSNLGFLRFDQGKVREALDLMEKELELNPDSADALAGKAICLEALGKHAEALEAYRAAAERDDNYTDCKNLRIQNYWSANACKTAAPLIRELFE